MTIALRNRPTDSPMATCTIAKPTSRTTELSVEEVVLEPVYVRMLALHCSSAHCLLYAHQNAGRLQLTMEVPLTLKVPFANVTVFVISFAVVNPDNKLPVTH